MDQIGIIRILTYLEKNVSWFEKDTLASKEKDKTEKGLKESTREVAGRRCWVGDTMGPYDY